MSATGPRYDLGTGHPELVSVSVTTLPSDVARRSSASPYRLELRVERKSSAPQPAQRWAPCALLQYTRERPLGALLRRISYCSGVSRSRHSASVSSTFDSMPEGTGFGSEDDQRAATNCVTAAATTRRWKTSWKPTAPGKRIRPRRRVREGADAVQGAADDHEDGAARRARGRSWGQRDEPDPPDREVGDRRQPARRVDPDEVQGRSRAPPRPKRWRDRRRGPCRGTPAARTPCTSPR